MSEFAPTDPVVVIATFYPAPGRRADVLAALETAIPAVHTEPGCELYAIHDHPDGSIMMIEKWTTVAELDAHGSSPAVARLNEELAGALATDVSVARLGPLPVGTAEQGAL